MHTYITDLIEGQGGSAALVRMLNQFGVCASSDTLARYIQAKASNPHTRIAQSLDMDSFTAVSADNIDFLHSYARHFKGSKNSSWHGTTIQVIQPLPSLSIHSEPTQQPEESHAQHSQPNDSVQLSISVQRTTTTQLSHTRVNTHAGSVVLHANSNSSTNVPQGEIIPSTEVCTRTTGKCTN